MAESSSQVNLEIDTKVLVIKSESTNCTVLFDIKFGSDTTLWQFWNYWVPSHSRVRDGIEMAEYLHGKSKLLAAIDKSEELSTL